jgi:HAD superfamily hydrolase (TIGR01484 family)
MKKLVIFDLDGTLAKSKSPIDNTMAVLLNDLLKLVKVAVISGGNWQQFENQLLANLAQNEYLKNLSLLPTCGTKFYQFRSNWQLIYSEDLKVIEKNKIIDALKNTLNKTGFKATKTWGEVIEDRGSQITFSGLGQQAPIEEKVKWDADFVKRKVIKTLLDALLPMFSVRLGGTTSIDITKLGIDKAYGIMKLRDTLKVEINEMVFIGDALFEDGNDFPAKNTGVICIQIRNPEETKLVIETIITCLN